MFILIQNCRVIYFQEILTLIFLVQSRNCITCFFPNDNLLTYSLNRSAISSFFFTLNKYLLSCFLYRHYFFFPVNIMKSWEEKKLIHNPCSLIILTLYIFTHLPLYSTHPFAFEQDILIFLLLPSKHIRERSKPKSHPQTNKQEKK